MEKYHPVNTQFQGNEIQNLLYRHFVYQISIWTQNCHLKSLENAEFPYFFGRIVYPQKSSSSGI